MKRNTEDETAKAEVSLYCSGVTRAGLPCGSRVSRQGDVCGKCVDPVETPYPIPDTSDDRGSLGDSVDVPGGWTMAESVADRLRPYGEKDDNLQRLVQIGVNLASKSKAESTQVTYATHWRTFETFRESYDLGTEFPVPAEHVLLFIAYLTDRGSLRDPGENLSHGYIRQIAGAIQNRHTSRGVTSPTDDPAVAEILTGYAKVFGTGQEGKAPLGVTELGIITAHLISDSEGSTFKRDRLIAMLATHADLRLSLGQISALNGEHVVYEDGSAIGLLVTGRGGSLSPIALERDDERAACAVDALTDLSPNEWGPVFRNASGVRLSRVGISKILQRVIAGSLGTDRWEKGTIPSLDAAERSLVASDLQSDPLETLAARALLLNGYWAAFRGNEVAVLKWSDLRSVSKGIEWRVRSAKNDQLGNGARTAVPRIDDPFLCAVQAMDTYRSGVESFLGRSVGANDPVFFSIKDSTANDIRPLSRAALAETVNRVATAAGLPDGPYSVHSLRAGFVTDAIDAGVNAEQIALHGRWKNAKSLGPYYRRAQIWGKSNPASQIASLLFNVGD